jgi:hypothetical protein
MSLPKKRAAAMGAAVPIPIQHWFSNLQNVDELRKVFSNPSFMLACAIVRNSAMPTGANLSSSDDHALAINHAYLAGYCDFVDSLNRLTVLPVENMQEDEWSYVQPNNNLNL